MNYLSNVVFHSVHFELKYSLKIKLDQRQQKKSGDLFSTERHNISTILISHSPAKHEKVEILWKYDNLYL